jgi:hypothetical protein
MMMGFVHQRDLYACNYTLALSSDRDIAAEDISDRITDCCGDRVTGLASYPGADVYEGVADETLH